MDYNFLSVVLGILLLFLTGSAKAVVYLPEYHRTYDSLPGLFGGRLSTDATFPSVQAYLTLVPNQQYMCQDELKHIQPKPTIGAFTPVVNATATNGNDEDNNYAATIEPLPVPEDGIPIALLVQRGMCTFYEKAVMASQYGSAVKYVIIYDNQVAPDLVPMSSESSTDMTLFFIASLSGQELRDLIFKSWQSQHSPVSQLPSTSPLQADSYTSSNETEAISYPNGLLVLLDGTIPDYMEAGRSPLNAAAYFLAAMSGFLAFLIFFGCLLICAQCGWITAAPDEHGRIVLFAGGPGIHPGEGLARMIRIVDKLTPEQVQKHLKEEEFVAGGSNDDENGGGCCCAICLDEFEDRETVKVLPCNHKFHEPCLVPWLTERHASCPLCKLDVLKHVLEQEKQLKKENSDGDAGDKETLDMEARGGSRDDTTTPHSTTMTNNQHRRESSSRGNSPVRSVWYRLRGWSPIANTGPTDSGEPDDEHGNNNTSSSSRTVVSEIEMEDRTSGSDHMDAESTI